MTNKTEILKILYLIFIVIPIITLIVTTVVIGLGLIGILTICLIIISSPLWSVVIYLAIIEEEIKNENGVI